MAEGRRGRRGDLRLLAIGLSPALMLSLAGCLSVSIETEVGRDGGGLRSYEYRIDAAPDGQGLKKAGWLKMADMGLDGIAGVVPVDSSYQQLEDGSTVSRLSCRADDIRKLSQDDDSVSLDVSRRGLWVVYRYRESYKLGTGRGDQAAAAVFAGKRFRHRLRLPGRIVGGNSDSLSGGWAVWSRPMFGESERVVMEAESRALNPIVPLTAGASLIVGAVLIVYRKRLFGREGL